MFDPEVLKAVEDEAKARDEPKSVTHARAKRYAKEIVPAFSAYTYFRIGAGLAKWLSTALYRVRVGAFEEAELYKVPPDASVVFVINHRSNMDYVLVTYLVSESSALSYAVGEWARVWALQGLIRAMGGYFVRRDSSNALYRKVLARYVHMATGVRRDAGCISRGRAHARRHAASAEAGAAQLHGVGLRPQRRPRHRLRARSASTTTACWRIVSSPPPSPRR
jgi:glycerol-3-phosphate O-acyltransferase